MELVNIIDNISNVVYTDEELEKYIQDDENSEIKLVHSIYGAIPVTQKILDKINGKLVYGLTGQGLIDSDPKQRPRFVHQFTIFRIDRNNARVTYSNGSFDIYVYQDVFCSGSGADPVYVFIP